MVCVYSLNEELLRLKRQRESKGYVTETVHERLAETKILGTLAFAKSVCQLTLYSKTDIVIWIIFMDTARVSQ